MEEQREISLSRRSCSDHLELQIIMKLTKPHEHTRAQKHIAYIIIFLVSAVSVNHIGYLTLRFLLDASF